MVLKSSISFLFVQKKKREEAEKLRKLEEERLRKAMAADAARKEAERLHRVGHDARIAWKKDFAGWGQFCSKIIT